MTGPLTPKGGQAGYTLVELMIVLALMGMLSLLLVSGLGFGARVWETGERQSQSLRQIALAQIQLRRMIASAYPVITTADPQRPRVAFDGTERRLTLIAFDQDVPAATRSTLTIGQTETGGASDLRISSTPELALDPGARTRHRAVVRGIKELRFAYLGDGGGAWENSWQDRRRLPRLVRVSVTFPDGDPRHWPDLVIAPRLAADVACVFDALAKSCSGR
jgi:general secretion pathway protein J